MSVETWTASQEHPNPGTQEWRNALTCNEQNRAYTIHFCFLLISLAAQSLPVHRVGGKAHSTVWLLIRGFAQSCLRSLSLCILQQFHEAWIAHWFEPKSVEPASAQLQLQPWIWRRKWNRTVLSSDSHRVTSGPGIPPSRKSSRHLPRTRTSFPLVRVPFPPHSRACKPTSCLTEAHIPKLTWRKGGDVDRKMMPAGLWWYQIRAQEIRSQTRVHVKIGHPNCMPNRGWLVYLFPFEELNKHQSKCLNKCGLCHWFWEVAGGWDWLNVGFWGLDWLRYALGSDASQEIPPLPSQSEWMPSWKEEGRGTKVLIEDLGQDWAPPVDIQESTEQFHLRVNYNRYSWFCQLHHQD